MSKLIEQAVQRLEKLRGAGIVATPLNGQAGPRHDGRAKRSAIGLATTEPPSKVASKQSRQVELNADSMAMARVFPPGAGPVSQASQFRTMKRPLIRNIEELKQAGHSRSNLIMVTSALSGEGKSFTAANFAMTMANEEDHTVLLVDADVARPSLARMLGFESRGGLLDVLEKKVSLQDVLLGTNVDKLAILPSGAPRPRATELLASEDMRALLDEMASRYPDRIIIFDSPPLLLTTESSVLASHMGQIVIVVRADHTPQAAVQRALASIASNPSSNPVKLLMMNQAHPKMIGGPGYGYAYGGEYAPDGVR